MVKADMGNYVLIALVFVALNGLVPVILQGPLMAGFHIYCLKRLLGRPTEFADLFQGFNFHTGPRGHAGDYALHFCRIAALRHPRTGGGGDV
jgi:hypothetical protein